MKKFKVVFMSVLLAVSFLACSQKTRKHPTKGRTEDLNGYVANSQWSYLANLPYSQLQSSDAAQREFIGQNFDSGPVGNIVGTNVVMHLQFNPNGSVAPQSTRLGILIWDDYAYQNPGQEYALYYGPEISGWSISGGYQQTGANSYHVDVRFIDTYNYNIRVDGDIVNGTFYGAILYNVDSVLGSFSLPTQGVIN